MAQTKLHNVPINEPLYIISYFRCIKLRLYALCILEQQNFAFLNKCDHFVHTHACLFIWNIDDHEFNLEQTV